MKEGDWVKWFDEKHEAHTGRVISSWRELEVKEDATNKIYTIFENQAETLEICNELVKVGGEHYRCESLNTRFHQHEAHIDANTRIFWKKG